LHAKLKSAIFALKKHSTSFIFTNRKFSISVARIQRQEQRQEQLQQFQFQQQREAEIPHHLPASELPSPAALLQRSARKSLSIKIEDFDSESSVGRRSSKSVSISSVSFLGLLI
jgi:hypothetical protein